MKEDKLTPEKNALRKFNAHHLREIETPFGHVLSVLLEEMGITNVNLKKIIAEINSYSCSSRIKTVETPIYLISYEHDAIVRYIKSRRINSERKFNLQSRIEDELCGITTRDRFFEKKGTFEKNYSH